jgi:hypothetical protein
MGDNNGPSGPYIALPPPPPPPPPPASLALYVPAGAVEAATPEQLRQIAIIEVEFAQRVSNLLAKAYTELAAVLKDVRKE